MKKRLQDNNNYVDIVSKTNQIALEVITKELKIEEKIKQEEKEKSIDEEKELLEEIENEKKKTVIMIFYFIRNVYLMQLKRKNSKTKTVKRKKNSKNKSLKLEN